jgi:hypothetical protein
VFIWPEDVGRAFELLEAHERPRGLMFWCARERSHRIRDFLPRCCPAAYFLILSRPPSSRALPSTSIPGTWRSMARWTTTPVGEPAAGADVHAPNAFSPNAFSASPAPRRRLVEVGRGGGVIACGVVMTTVAGGCVWSCVVVCGRVWLCVSRARCERHKSYVRSGCRLQQDPARAAG